MPSSHHIVILGAGFGGIQTYLSLRRARRPDVRITIINDTNYFLFTPLLHEVATGGLGHHNVVEAVREIIGNDPASFLQARIHGIDLSKKTVQTSAGDVPYDFLVIATGATTAFYGIPGAKEHGYVLKNLGDALYLRNRIIDQFEEAARAKTAAERMRLLSFAVVGGGATGVETVTEMADLFNDTFRRFYRSGFNRHEVALTLITADPDVLMSFHPHIRRHARKVLQREGIIVKPNKIVASVTPEGLTFSDQTTLPATTVLWAAGVHPAMDPPEGTACAHGRIMVDAVLRVTGQECVFALGDAACFHGPDGKPLPMLAQVAVQQGPVAADNIFRTLDGRPLTSFAFRMNGQLVSLGRFQAAAQIGPLRLSGPIAWFLWRTVYFFNFHAWSKRVRIGADWFVNLFFPRDITRA